MRHSLKSCPVVCTCRSLNVQMAACARRAFLSIRVDFISSRPSNPSHALWRIGRSLFVLPPKISSLPLMRYALRGIWVKRIIGKRTPPNRRSRWVKFDAVKGGVMAKVKKGWGSLRLQLRFKVVCTFFSCNGHVASVYTVLSCYWVRKLVGHLNGNAVDSRGLMICNTKASYGRENPSLGKKVLTIARPELINLFWRSRSAELHRSN
ncbi:hypothetical protein I7I50_08810 [Histoplasma capsulatum G186AR]|uniref:Uncharacterized protein n=1 Tax=Ajellomyces capsulatus TaxID=5037 RepID=A0A8H7YRE1_AJECA|nr:hypothetical protein I7I52_06324 [Histoplasma capsulatum]QSS73879.1 hypothetical protein I7I50_08810 [Histoplasma capsulatum G186AR]